MSTNLEQQLMRFAELLDESAPTITGDEIVSAAEHAGGSPTIMLRAHRSQQRSSRVAAFAAAAVLVVGLTGLIGVTVWRSDGPESVSDRPDDSPPPRPSDLPATGVVFRPEDALTVSLATETLIAECMAAQGIDYPIPTTDELIAGFGEWQPHAVLGIRRAGAAQRIGYHSSGVGGFGTASQANFVELLDPALRDQYTRALVGPDLAEATTPDDVTLTREGRITTGGCTGVAGVALGNFVDLDEQMRARVYDSAGLDDVSPSGSGFEDVAINDERVKSSLATWSSCVEQRTGEQASTPDELARRYLDGRYDASATDEEIATAVADADCQQQAQLWTTWYTVVAELTRDQLGAEAPIYDDWTRLRTQAVQSAKAVLDDRGIQPPDLN